jgi:serine/threonine protein kinase
VEEEVYFPEEVTVSNEAKLFVLGLLNKNPIKRLSIRQAIEHDFLRGPEKYRSSMM